MDDGTNEEVDLTKGLHHKRVSAGLFSVGLRVFALLGGSGLFFADKFKHMIDPSIDMYVYAGIAGFVIGKDEVLKMIGSKN